jgi:WD40 repeat protein
MFPWGLALRGLMMDRTNTLHSGVALLLAFLLFSLVPCTAQAQRNPSVQIVPKFGHAASVTSVAFSRDGIRALSGSYDQTLKLWDVATGTPVRTIKASSGAVLSIAFSPDGTQLLSGNSDKTMKLWDVASGHLLRTFEVGSEVKSVAFSPDSVLVASGSLDKIVKLWDVATGHLQRSLEGHSGIIYSVAFSPDGKRVLSGSDDKTLKLWDTATGAPIRSFETPKTVNSVAFSPDGGRLLSGCIGDDTIKVWEVGTGKLLRTFKGGAGAFSPDGTHVLSGNGSYAEGNAPSDYTLKLWDTATGELLRTFAGHSGPVSSVAFSPDGAHVLTGSEDFTLKLWEISTGQLMRDFGIGNSAAVSSVAFSPDGVRILSGGHDRMVRLWQAASGGQLLRTFKGPGMISQAAFSPDGGRVLSGSGVSESEYKISTTGAQLWDVASGELLRTLAKGEAVLAVAFSPDGTRVATSSLNKNTKLWDAATGALLRAFKMESGWDNSVAFSPDGTRVLAGKNLWNAVTGRLLRTFSVDGDSSEIHSVAFSPDGAHVLLGSDSGLRLWDAATGKLLRTFEQQGPKVVLAVAFSPDGTRILSGGDSLRLWDMATGALLGNFEGHAGDVASVAFSPDGIRALSGGWDATVRIWDLQRAVPLVTMIGTREGEWIAMTADGFFAASALGADEQLSVVRGLDVTTIGQVHQSLFYPDLVRETLAGDPNGVVREAAKVINLEKVVDSGPAPVVQISSHNHASQSSADLRTVEARITDRGQGVGRTEWRVNGITAAVVSKPSGPGPEYGLTQQLSLDPGDNSIEVISYNARNLIASLPARRRIKITGSASGVKPTLHVLAIGINAYVDQGWTPPGTDETLAFPPLKLAVNDAKALATAFRRAGADQYANVKVTEALDKDATAAGLQEIVERVASETNPRDTFVLFGAAHGTSQDGRFYLIPQDYNGGTNPASLRERAIGQDRLQDWLANLIKAKKVLVLLDTCESGALVAGYARSRTDAPASEAAIGRLHEATGRPVLTAAAEGKPAFEGYEGHGVFTWALLDALRNADRNGNGMIELSELVTHVQDQVPKLAASLNGRGLVAIAATPSTPDRQTAHFGSRGEDYPLVRRLQ